MHYLERINTMRKLPLLLLAALFLITGCKKNKENGESTTALKRDNYFIWDYMNAYYVWRDQIPQSQTPTSESPLTYFPRLRNTQDNWSMVTDDYDGLMSNVQNTGKSFGYSLMFGRYVDEYGNDTGERFAIVLHVHPNTPAKAEDIRRGDIISKLNGSPITDANRSQLVYANNISITLIRKDDNGIKFELTKQIASAAVYLDPIAEKKLIQKNGLNIEYMYYSDFLSTTSNGVNAHADLTAAISGFRAQNVDNFILDLRTNGGGTTASARHLCSLLAPESVVKAEKVLTKDISPISTSTTKFDKNVTTNLNLPGAKPTIYILTNKYSASASEMTIAGLCPYMDVVLIGEKTTGKYYGGGIVNIGTQGLKEPSLSNWGLYAMTFRFTNAEDFPGIGEPIEPTAANIIPEDFQNLKPLGSEEDQCVARALELSTGVAPEPGIIKRSPSSKDGRIFVPEVLMPAGVPHGMLITDTETGL